MLDSISDKDFLEDSASDEEFEKKFEDSIQAHKESGSRPSSSSSRPKTASRHREESESRTNLIAATILQVYSRMSKFVMTKKLSKSKIISLFGEYVTGDKLREVFLGLGFELSDIEVNFLFRDSGVPRNGVLRISDIYLRLLAEAQEDEEETPRGRNNLSADRLKKEVEGLLNDLSPKAIKKKKKRVKSIKAIIKRPDSCSSRSKARPPSVPTSRRDTHVQNYLRQSQVKKAKEKRDLDTTVDRCRREFEFDCIQKMGEANEIFQNQACDKSYRCIRKEDRTLKCHIYKADKFVEEISLENFIRKWKKLKNRKPNANESSVSQMTSKTLSTSNAKVNKNERQEELKKLLLETRDLTNNLKAQLKILEQKGIVRKQHKEFIIT